MNQLTKLTSRQKRTIRIQVARDVLAQLALGFYKPCRGVYASFRYKYFKYAAFEAGRELQCQLDGVEKCRVCGIGAAFVSLVRLYDRYRLNSDEAWNCSCAPSRLRRLLGRVFSVEQISMIETAFEGRQIDDTYLTRRQLVDSRNFNRRSDTATNDLRRIMQNIIRNKGTFVPPRYR